MNDLKNWSIEEIRGYAVLTLDTPRKKQNVLSTSVIQELNKALDHVASLNNITGLMICSGKSSGFIAGADISEFKNYDSIDAAKESIRYANNVLDRIESIAFPTVAVINGHCLGGGLELALACDYRVACDDTSARLGLPEVKLGIHPGFGGTVRLIEIIGVPQAMDIILSGRSVIPFSAKKMGIVDYSVPQRQLMRTAEYVLHSKPPVKRAGRALDALNLLPARKAMAKFLRKQVSARAPRSHYPAPYSVIDLWETHGGNREEMFVAEQQSVAMLAQDPTSRNLVTVFFLQEQLKSLGKNSNKQQFRHVHVIGAGVMGGDIASWCVLQGLTVTLHDRSTDALARATKRASQLFKKKLKQSRLIERAMDRFIPDLAGHGVGRADVVIEAIFENAEAKIGVFSEIEKTAKPDAILATNTSSIPLETISTALRKPGRLVGLHFFNPVAKMQLVEIVSGEKTYAKIAASAASFASQIGRLPVGVKSSPGFLVNRVLMPYTLESVALLKEGIPGPLIDKVATDFGMPMGPITLADTVGLDICLHVAENLCESFGGEVPEILTQKVKNGQLGKKSGEGFYKWKKGKAVKEKYSQDIHTDNIEDRLIFRYLNECVSCLDENIVENQSLLDGALIFGTGFAPFKGGPMNYIADQGVEEMHNKLLALSNQFGDRFKPSAGWKSLLKPASEDDSN